MRNRCPASLGILAVVIAVVSLAAGTVAGQTATKAKTTAAAKTYTPPRTPDGQPDLTGIWANNNVTPLERPEQWAGKQFLTPEEVAELKKLAAEVVEGDADAVFGDGLVLAALAHKKNPISYDPTTGNYNHFWIVDRDFDNRTSLITDPRDGRIPALTPEAQKRRDAAAEARRRPATGPEDRSLTERCITFGAPRIDAAYNSYFQIFQSRDYVAIGMETIHDARIIPLDGRPHINQHLRQWFGDPRGHWEGSTLVVDTTNYSPESNIRGSSEKLHVVERFTRVDPNTINYEVTFDDPTTWTKPWTAMIPLRKSNKELFEYACHEGNLGMFGILSGARAEERAAADAAKKGSN